MKTCFAEILQRTKTFAMAFVCFKNHVDKVTALLQHLGTLILIHCQALHININKTKSAVTATPNPSIYLSTGEK